MKKRWKIFWITCVVLASIGVICCIAALGLGVTAGMIRGYFPYGIEIGNGIYHHGEDEDGTKGTYQTEDFHQSYPGVNSIEMELFTGQVNVIMSEDEDITVETNGLDKRLKFNCYIDEDTLKLTSKKSLFHINDAVVGTITIRIPENMILNEADLDIKAGTLYIEEIKANELVVEVGSGEAKIDQFEANEVELNCGAGSIVASGAAKQEADVECGVGEITFYVTGAEEEYNYNIECGVGEIVCGSNSFSGLGNERTIRNPQASKEMNIECGVGNVTVNFK